MRRVADNTCRYDFEKRGAFGVFKSNGSVPIEYIMTTFDISELVRLSLARDINTDLNFDYLIQRDIDEERALAEISQYIASSPDKIQKDIIFLPPLLVSVVGVDENNSLEDYYPPCSFVHTQDAVGELYQREWRTIFKVENYPRHDGKKIDISSEDGCESITIDIESAKISLNITPSGIKGARLVVIDGQHRLFALSYLKKNMPELVEKLVVPVCIVFPSNSYLGNNDEIIQPTVPQVLRSLFVDVNSTVERVSGHFLTLLSDQTLGSIICREFCKSVLSKYNVEGLGLVEWNTKKHKESLEISREHTITSIGVINSAFDDCFKTKNGAKLLYSILKYNDSNFAFEFGKDEYDEELALPEYFPWRDYQSIHKAKLADSVNAIITPMLIKIFFETSFYKEYYERLNNYFKEKELALKSERSNEANFLIEVKNHYYFNKPFSDSARIVHGNVRLEILELISKSIPSFARKSIFQKAVIESWSLLCAKFIAHKLNLDIIPEIIKCYMEQSFNPACDIFNEQHLYLQDTIFSGSRIKVTRSARKQISRLLLSFGVKRLPILGISDQERSVIKELAETEIGSFITQMREDKRRVFESSYKTNFSISTIDRERLMVAEQNKSADIKKTAGALSEFDKIVSELISQDLKNSYEDLSNTIEFQNFVFSFESITDDEL